MRYQLTIELENEPNPGTANHFEALLANWDSQIKVLEVKKLDN